MKLGFYKGDLRSRLVALAMVIAVSVGITACNLHVPDIDLPDGGSSSEAVPATSIALDPTPAPAMKIVTPTPVTANATVTNDADGTPAAATESPETYVVQDGDSLYTVAVRFGVELDQLIALNNLSDPNDIYAGQELKIPPRS